MGSKWSDVHFLDGLRQSSDSLADQTVLQLIAQREMGDVSQLFRLLGRTHSPFPDEVPEPLRQFLEATAGLPPGVDLEKLGRGGQVFLEHAAAAATVLLAGSLPRGYGAPCLCEILTISQDLERHPYDRLMGVLQLLVDIYQAGAFAPQGKAIVTAQKLRLLHAGVRTLVPRFRPDYQKRHGLPVNHEDMLATIMGFSYLVIEGLTRLGLDLSPRQADDLYYCWRIYAQLMGIHPEGHREDDSLIPATLAEAGEFYASYERRQTSAARDNPAGVQLTRDNLELMENLIPQRLRWLGLRWAPRIAMTEILTPEEMARVGYRPQAGHRVIRTFLHLVLRLTQGIEEAPFSIRLATLIFQGMIDHSRGGVVEFTIPVTLAGLRSKELV